MAHEFGNVGGISFSPISPVGTEERLEDLLRRLVSAGPGGIGRLPRPRIRGVEELLEQVLGRIAGEELIVPPMRPEVEVPSPPPPPPPPPPEPPAPSDTLHTPRDWEPPERETRETGRPAGGERGGRDVEWGGDWDRWGERDWGDWDRWSGGEVVTGGSEWERGRDVGRGWMDYDVGGGWDGGDLFRDLLDWGGWGEVYMW